MSITAAPRATATRDLQQLVEQGALHRTGQLKGTRYHLRPDPGEGPQSPSALR